MSILRDSEEWRRECEARRVLTMDKDRREAFYKGVLEKRGREAANRLIDDVNVQRRAAKENEGHED